MLQRHVNQHFATQEDKNGTKKNSDNKANSAISAHRVPSSKASKKSSDFQFMCLISDIFSFIHTFSYFTSKKCAHNTLSTHSAHSNTHCAPITPSTPSTHIVLKLLFS